MGTGCTQTPNSHHNSPEGQVGWGEAANLAGAAAAAAANTSQQETVFLQQWVFKDKKAESVLG